MSELVVTLVEMSSGELAVWLPAALDRTIAARIGAGESPSRATAQATAQRESGFPDGAPAQGHHVLRVIASGESAGALWIGPGQAPESEERYLFIMDLDEARRDDEFVRAVLRAVERWILGDGARRLSLTVIGADAHELALYAQLGYVVAATAMFKGLRQSA